jgi:4-hydroxy-tetrahydrodipicolinate reductase
MTLRVLHVGLGPIGAAVARQITGRRGLRIVGAVDIDPALDGRDVGDAIGLGRKLRVRIGSDLSKTIRATKPDVAVLCTSSSFKAVLPQLEAVLRHRLPIVTTTEEVAYPARRNRRLAAVLDRAARKAKVAVLATGVNPGFTMDALPIALSAVCERVDRIEVQRVQDARLRRVPFQQKIGAGLSPQEFQARVADGRVRHVGFTESIQMIADALGWPVDRITEDVLPKIAEQDVSSDAVQVLPGQACGLMQTAIGYVKGEARIMLRLEAYLGAPVSHDTVTIDGSPRIQSRIEGGVHGDIATAAMVVNAIPAVVRAAPGFRTMRDMPLPSFFSGR